MRKLRDLKRQIAALAKERQALGGAVPDDVATWWRAWEQPSSPLPIAPLRTQITLSVDLLGKLMIVEPSSPWAEVTKLIILTSTWSTVIPAEPRPALMHSLPNNQSPLTSNARGREEVVNRGLGVW